jgi:hypothetical protein
VLGALERPDRRQLYSRWVDVRGWALSRDADVVIRIFAGRSLLREMAPTLPRPDVIARLPSWAAGRACGFDQQISLESAPRRFWLRIVAVRVDDPTRVRTLGVSLLTRAGASHRTRPRAAYRDVWNAASQSLTDARFSVSGTADVDELERSGASTADDIVVEAGVTPTDTVLEIGCGVGRVGAKLAPRCAQWIGADVSDQMLGHAQRALPSLRNVSFVRLNGVDLAGVADTSIDVAYCTGVFSASRRPPPSSHCSQRRPVSQTFACAPADSGSRSSVRSLARPCLRPPRIFDAQGLASHVVCFAPPPAERTP